MTERPHAPTIPVNELKRTLATHGEQALQAAERALRSGWWLNGQEAENFCAEFARYVGARHCIGVANGTDALEIALRAIISVKKPAGREVVTVANAGGYTTIASFQVGLKPVFVDIERHSQLMAIDSAISALSADTAVVVATHLYGGVVDVPKLRAAMDEAGYASIPILEDCAQAHGARLDGRMAGSFGDVATFSFYPTKNLGAFGDAGAIVAQDSSLFERCVALRQYGWSGKYLVSEIGGRNSRLDEVQAAVLRAKLPSLDAANDRRRAILNRYVSSAPSGLQIVQGAHSVAHLAVVLSDNRDALKQHLASHAVATEIHYPILDCDQPAWRSIPSRIAPGGLPVSKQCVSELLTLPCFPDLRDDEVNRVCEALSSWRTRA